MINDYAAAPQYIWYSAQGNPPAFKVHWWKGVKYVAFITEPEEHIIDRYKLTHVGTGDFNYIERVV